MSTVTDEGRTNAILAHITAVGWVIALILNNEKKDEFASFYIRQTLGIFIVVIAAILVSNSLFFMLPILGMVLYFGVFAVLILSLVTAINREMKPIPILGKHFQQWFKSL